MSGFHNIDALLSEQTWMKRVARSLVGAGAADDLVQDALHAALRSPPASDRPVRAWLSHVLRNKARKGWRTEQRRGERELAASEPGIVMTPLDQTSVLETQTKLCEALRDLDEPFRGTLFAHYYEDKSLAEIAREQGVPEGTVRWRHHEALARIRAALDRSEGGRTAWLAALAPLCAPSPARAALVGKALIVKKLIAVAAAVIVAVAMLLVWNHYRERGTERVAHAGAPSVSATAGASLAKPGSLDPAASSVGSLRLEGQVLGPAGTPVGGAEVTLADPKRTTTTDSDGSFAFDQLADGIYTLFASREDLVSGTVAKWLTSTSDPVVLRMVSGGAIEVSVVDDDDRPLAGAQVRYAQSREDRVELLTEQTDLRGITLITPVVPGSAVLHVEADGFAPMQLVATGGATGSVGHTIAHLQQGSAVSGRIVDEAGHGLAGVKIATTATSVTSDGDGQFTFPALAPGNYELAASDRWHEPVVQRVAIGADHNPPITIAMPAGAQIVGSVVDAQGVAISGALVRVFWLASMHEPVATAITTQAGQFRVGGLLRASYAVNARINQASSPDLEIDLADETVPQAKLVLSQTGTIGGIVVDSAKRPVPEVFVSLVDIAGRPASKMLASTDSAGAFRFEGVSAGAFSLRAVRRIGDVPDNYTRVLTGEQDARVVLRSLGRVTGRLVIDGGGPPRHAAVVFLSNRVPTAPDGSFVIDAPQGIDLLIYGEGFEPERVSFVPVAANSSTDLGVIRVHPGRTVRGKVVDEHGRPVQGASVFFEHRRDRSDPGQRVAISGPSGAFSLEHVKSVGLELLAEHPILGRSRVVAVPDGAQSPVVLALNLLGVVRGVVTQAKRPVANVAVTIDGEDNIVFTGPDGSFLFERVGVGRVTVSARPDAVRNVFAGQPVTTTVEVTGGTTVAANLELPSGATIQIGVRPEPDAPVSVAMVALIAGSHDAATLAMMVSGSRSSLWFPGSANVELRDVPPGVYSACAVGITGSISDWAFTAWARAHKDDLHAACEPVTIGPSGPDRSVMLEPPTMFPDFGS